MIKIRHMLNFEAKKLKKNCMYTYINFKSINKCFSVMEIKQLKHETDNSKEKKRAYSFLLQLVIISYFYFKI